MTLPETFDEIVAEIVQHTGLPEEEVKHRVWKQSLEPGWNVIQDVARFGVTPFQYDERMERLYRDGDGFVFDSLVFWAIPARNRWAQLAAERIALYAERHGYAPPDVRILALGDGAGNDSLFLAHRDFKIDYFDVPGSKTSAFACSRFEQAGFLGNRIRLIDDYQTCLNRRYDVVLSFEVLEHLTNPHQAIEDIGHMLKEGGLAIITDDFGDIVSYLPTHLKSTAHLMGKTPFLFWKKGMVLTWYSREELFKPYEFTKLNRRSRKDYWSLWSDGNIRGLFFSRYTMALNRFLGKLVYFGS